MPKQNAYDYVKHIEKDERIIKVEAIKNCTIKGIIEVYDKKYTFMVDLEDFPIQLPKYFILKKDIGLRIPHLYGHGVEKYSEYYWVCYTRKENLMWDIYNHSEIIKLTFNAFADCLTTGLDKKNLNDFKGDFSYYWLRSKHDNIVEKVQAYFEPRNDIFRLKRKKDKVYEIEENANLTPEEINTEEDLNGMLHIPIKKEYLLIPPKEGECWGEEELLDLLNNGLENSIKKFLIHEVDASRFDSIVFSQPFEQSYILWGIKANELSNKINYLQKGFYENSNMQCYPISIENYSRNYLKCRSGSSQLMENKRILVLGVGSVGSHIVDQLCMSGYESITVVDKDRLTKDNIYRNNLGKLCIDTKKVNAIKVVMELKYPYVKINPIDKDVLSVFDVAINLKNFDIIISALGNPTIERFIVERLYRLSLPPVVMSWIEPLGVAHHSLFMKDTNKGCFNCLLIDENGNFSYKNKFSDRKSVV